MKHWLLYASWQQVGIAMCLVIVAVAIVAMLWERRNRRFDGWVPSEKVDRSYSHGQFYAPPDIIRQGDCRGLRNES